MSRLCPLAILALCALPSVAMAAAATTAYPSRPVRMIVPFVPGGSVDFVARILQPRYSEALGQQVVIDNRAGASGNIAVELTANSPADGHTILLGNVGAAAINPSVFPKFPVQAGRDLQAVTLIVDVPGALGVHATVPVATLKEFIEYAKARPGQLNYGSSAAGSAQSLAMEYFMGKAGIKLVSIPYKGGAGAATLAVLAGEVTATMLTTASFVPHLKGGKVKVLAVISPKRVSQLPEVPTMIEHGYPELRLVEALHWLPFLLLAITCYYSGMLLDNLYPALETSGPQMLVWGFFISTILLYHGTYTINSLAHRFGSLQRAPAAENR
jgi:tripartite-type tricarboxylate transporter receptor subunit TctC